MIGNLNKECICEELVIIGAGGFGREVLWLIDEINEKQKRWKVVGFIDENKSLHDKYINGKIVLGGFEYLKLNKNVKYVCAIGNADIRKNIVKSYCSDLTAATLIHPKIKISEFNKIGEGAIICSGTILTVNINIGSHSIINLDCTIGHDVVMEEFVTVYPGCNISGNVLLESGCEIGTGTQIIQGKTVGNNSIIGAGSVVVRDIAKNKVAVGIPAKEIKSIV
ncbi:MAG: acetyltransferase [Clostridium chrysemydis]|uniref:acetyltransferase n=1 Tax=Clostridium TaxID=1485 RepID=UPI002152DE9D|nr:acetyltransferase [Clostridium sp. LY3-2]MCR6513719.1 acetyltransferase [Clostridium sp. LY3-2]